MSISEIRRYHFNQKVTDFRGTVANNQSVIRDLTNVRSGSPVRSWQMKLKHHIDASSDYYATRNRVVVGKYTGVYNCSVGIESCVDTVYPNYQSASVPVDLDPSLQNSALGNFLSNAHDVVSPFKGLTFLGELKETIKMLKRPASAFRDGLSKYLRAVRRHGRFFDRKKSLKRLNQAISSTWLEYCYGWRPLMKDIKDAADAYSQHEADVQYLRAYGKAEKLLWDYQDDPWQLYFANYGRYQLVRHYRQHQKCVYKGLVQLKPEIQADAARNVMRLSGFGIEEFIPTAWELVPYSFVVDYFSNIGTILNSMIPLSYDWVYWSCATTRTSRVINEPISGPKSQNTWNWSETFVPGVHEIVAYSRSEPTLALPTPQVELPGSNWTWANLLALASSKSSKL